MCAFLLTTLFPQIFCLAFLAFFQEHRFPADPIIGSIHIGFLVGPIPLILGHAPRPRGWHLDATRNSNFQFPGPTMDAVPRKVYAVCCSFLVAAICGGFRTPRRITARIISVLYPYWSRPRKCCGTGVEFSQELVVASVILISSRDRNSLKGSYLDVRVSMRCAYWLPPARQATALPTERFAVIRPTTRRYLPT